MGTSQKIGAGAGIVLLALGGSAVFTLGTSQKPPAILWVLAGILILAGAGLIAFEVRQAQRVDPLPQSSEGPPVDRMDAILRRAMRASEQLEAAQAKRAKGKRLPDDEKLLLKQADEDAKPKPPFPHAEGKNYSATARHEVTGQGRYRSLTCTLHDVGDGYDSGVEVEIVSPSGQKARTSWGNLEIPATRRRIANDGCSVWAREPGSYSVTWRTRATREFSPEVVAQEQVELPATGPLPDWVAHHAGMGTEVILQVDREEGHGGLLRGFLCQITGPGGEWDADDRIREQILGIIAVHNLPNPKGQGSFSFPQDFRKALALRDMIAGTYKVYWTAWDLTDDMEQVALDVAHDTFEVTRSGLVV